MQHPRIVVLERDARLAELLAPLARDRRWVLERYRQREAFLSALDAAEGCVALIQFSDEPERELRLLAQLVADWPHVPTIAVGDHDPGQQLLPLCWDLGAGYASFPPQSWEQLPAVVEGWMGKLLARAGA